MNLTIRLFGREFLTITAHIEEPPEEPDPVNYSIGFAAGELAGEY